MEPGAGSSEKLVFALSLAKGWLDSLIKQHFWHFDEVRFDEVEHRN